MNALQRKSIDETVATLKARLDEAFEEKAAAVYSQAWVDKRRLLFAEETLALLSLTLEGDALDARAFGEALARLLHRGRDLAPGHGLEEAAEAILHALEQGVPDADAHD